MTLDEFERDTTRAVDEVKRDAEALNRISEEKARKLVAEMEPSVRAALARFREPVIRIWDRILR